jgi:hypothetical protein
MKRRPILPIGQNLASTCLLPVFSIDLAGNGKLGKGFTASDGQEE